MMRIAATGFVSPQAGSVASANALLLRGLLERGCTVVFFSKASFVDPRPAVGEHPQFLFANVDNRFADRLRARLQRIPALGRLAGMLDSRTYNRLLVRHMNAAHAEEKFDLGLWLGEYAHGRLEGVPTVSFVQGPPGTDARSIRSHFKEISAVAGGRAAWKWRAMARFRLSKLGLPPLGDTDRFIVGSSQSQRSLQGLFGIPEQSIRILPYPIDLVMFRPPTRSLPSPSLRCLWLGRIVPRKRLDLFLDAAAAAIRQGVDLQLTIVGGVGFVPGYEKLIRQFPFPGRLAWHPSLVREKVPALMQEHDLLAQPSEEENFGSSVAEAQACGLPVIVGATNGNRDYLCGRDIALEDYRVETLAGAFSEMALRKEQGRWGDPMESRRCAEKHFAISDVTDRLLELLSTFAVLHR